jgi:hypothetical protein
MPKTRRRPSVRRSKTAKKARFAAKGSKGATNCSPTGSNDYTCFEDDSLRKMRGRWNARHRDDKIDSTDPRKIWMELRSRMSDVCSTERCWLRQQFIKDDLDSQLRHYTFVPDAPREWKKNPMEWLTSTEMIAVMKQYEKKYKCFEFMGPSPIDFDSHMLYGECVWEELCKFNLANLRKRGKTKIGIIFNHDKHWQPGSHWVSLFINMRAKQPYIHFFDSNGDAPPPEIKALIDKIKSQGEKMGITFSVEINKVEHQDTDSECGMYALYFIIQSLTDRKGVKDFNDSRIPDAVVTKLRKVYFTPS